MEPPPGPYLCISGRISLLSIAESGLQVLMPQPLANGRQTHAPVDEFSRVRMPKLVERAGKPGLRAVMIPAFLHRLVAQWSSPPVLFRSEERPVFVAHAFEVGPEKLHETRIVEQDRSPLVTLPHNGQMFIVEREVKILHVQGKPLTDPQTGLRKQTEEESVTQMLGGNGFENAFNVGALHATRLRRIEFHPVDLAHRVRGQQLLLLGPGQKACHRCLFARSGCRAKMGMHLEERSQDVCSDRLYRPLVKRTQLGEISRIGAARVWRMICVG